MIQPRARLAFLVAVTVALVATGCARRRVPAPPRQPTPAPRTTPTPTPPRPAPSTGYAEEGIASWYGVPYHGRRAANGEIYDMHKMTAAHRTLPFETVVRVTNLRNGRQTEVRINDRGPFIEGRIIDLSLAAAREIDMVAAGIVPVRVEIVSGPHALDGFFTVQVGAFQMRENAVRLQQQLAARYPPVHVVEYDSPRGLFYRVRVGRVRTLDDARQLAEKLRREEQFVPFVVRLDE